MKITGDADSLVHGVISSAHEVGEDDVLKRLVAQENFEMELRKTTKGETLVLQESTSSRPNQNSGIIDSVVSSNFRVGDSLSDKSIEGLGKEDGFSTGHITNRAQKYPDDITESVEDTSGVPMQQDVVGETREMDMTPHINLVGHVDIESNLQSVDGERGERKQMAPLAEAEGQGSSQEQLVGDSDAFHHQLKKAVDVRLREIKEFRAETGRMADEREELLSTAEASQIDVDPLTDEMAKNKVQSIVEERDHLVAQLQTALEQLHAATERQSLLESELRGLREERDDEKSRYTVEISSLQQQVTDLAKEHTRLASNIMKTAQTLEQVHGEKKRLEGKVDASILETQKLEEETSVELENWEEHIRSFEIDKKNPESAIEDLQQQLQRLEEETRLLESTSNESSRSVQKAAVEILQLSTEVDTLKQEIEENKNKSLEQVAELQTLREQLQATRERETLLGSEIVQLKLEKDDWTRKLSVQVLDLQQQLHELGENHADVLSNSKDLESSLEDLRGEKEWLSSHVDNIVQERQRREVEMNGELGTWKDQVQGLKSENLKFLYLIEEANSSLQRVNDEKVVLATRFDEFSQSLQEALGEKTQLANEVNKLEEEKQREEGIALALAADLRTTRDQLLASNERADLLASDLKCTREERDEENLKSSARVKELQMQLQGLREENAHVVIKASKLDQLVEDLQSDKGRLLGELDQVVRQRLEREDESAVELETWKEHVQTLEAGKMTSELLIDDLKTQLRRLGEDNKKLTTLSRETSQSLQQLWEENTKLINEVNKLEQEKQKQEGEKVELMAGLQTVWGQLQASSSREAVLVSELSGLGERREVEEASFGTKITELEQQLQEMIREKADLSNTALESSRMLEDLRVKSFRVLEELRAEKVQLVDEVTELMNVRHKKEEETAREQALWTEQLQGLESEKVTNLSVIKDLNQQLQKSGQEILQLTAKDLELTQVLQELREETTRLGSEIEKLEEVKERQEGERLELAAELQVAWDQIQAVREHDSLLNSELLLLKEERDAEKRRLDAEVQELRRQLQELGDQQVQSGTKVTELSKRLNELRGQQELQDQNALLTNELSLLEQEKEKIAVGRDALFEETQALKLRVQSLEEEKRKLVTEIDELNQWLQKPAAERRQLATKLDEMTSLLQRLQEDKSQLVSTVSKLEQEIERRQVENLKLNDQVRDLEENKKGAISTYEDSLLLLQYVEEEKEKDHITKLLEESTLLVQTLNDRVRTLEEEKRSLVPLYNESLIRVQSLLDEKAQVTKSLQKSTSLVQAFDADKSQLVNIVSNLEEELERRQEENQKLNQQVQCLEEEKKTAISAHEATVLQQKSLEEEKAQVTKLFEESALLAQTLNVKVVSLEEEKESIQSLQKHCQEDLLRLKSLEEEKPEMVKLLKESTVLVQTLNAQLVSLEGENKSLVLLREESRCQLQSLEGDKLQLAKLLEESRELVQGFQVDNLQLVSSLSKLQEELDKRQEENQRSSDQLRGLEDEKESSMFVQEEALLRLHCLEEEKAQLSKSLEDSKFLVQELQVSNLEHASTIEKLEREIQKMQEAVHSVEDKIQSLDDEKANLQSMYAESVVQLQTADEEKAQGTTSLEKLSALVQVLQVGNSQLVTKVEQEVRRRQEDVQILNDQVHSLEDEKMSVVSLQRQSLLHLQSLEEEKAQVAKLLKESTLLVEGLRQNKLQLEEEIQTLSDQVHSLKEEQNSLVSSLEESLLRLQLLEDEKVQSTKSLEESSLLVQSLEVDNSQHISHVSKLEQEIRRVKEEAEFLNAQLLTLEEEKISSSAAQNELFLHFQSLAEEKTLAAKSSEELSLHVVRLQVENSNLVSTVSGLELEVKSRQADVQSLSIQLHSLEEDRQSITAVHQESLHQLQASEEKGWLAKDLEESGALVQELLVDNFPHVNILSKFEEEIKQQGADSQLLRHQLEEEKKSSISAHENSFLQLQLLEEKAQVAKSLEDASVPVKVLREEIDTLKSDAFISGAEKGRCTSNLRVLQKQVHDISAQRDQLLSRVSATQEQLQELQMDKEHLVFKLVQSENEARKCREDGLELARQEAVRTVVEKSEQSRQLMEIKQQLESFSEEKIEFVQELGCELQQLKQPFRNVEENSQLTVEIHASRQELHQVSLEKTEMVTNLYQELDKLLRTVGEEKAKVAHEQRLSYEKTEMVTSLCQELDGLLRRVRDEKERVAEELSNLQQQMLQSSDEKASLENKVEYELDKHRQHVVELAVEKEKLLRSRQELQASHEERIKLEKEVTIMKQTGIHFHSLVANGSVEKSQLHAEVEEWRDAQRVDQDETFSAHSIAHKNVSNYASDIKAKAYREARLSIANGPAQTTQEQAMEETLGMFQQERVTALYAKQASDLVVDSVTLHFCKIEKENADLAMSFKQLEEAYALLQHENGMLIEKLDKASEDSDMEAAHLLNSTYELKGKSKKCGYETLHLREKIINSRDEKGAAIVAIHKAEGEREIAQKAQEDTECLRRGLRRSTQEHEAAIKHPIITSKELEEKLQYLQAQLTISQSHLETLLAKSTEIEVDGHAKRESYNSLLVELEGFWRERVQFVQQISVLRKYKDTLLSRGLEVSDTDERLEERLTSLEHQNQQQKFLHNEIQDLIKELGEVQKEQDQLRNVYTAMEVELGEGRISKKEMLSFTLAEKTEDLEELDSTQTETINIKDLTIQKADLKIATLSPLVDCVGALDVELIRLRNPAAVIKETLLSWVHQSESAKTVAEEERYLLARRLETLKLKFDTYTQELEKKDAALLEADARLLAVQSELEWKKEVSSGLQASLLERNSYIQTAELALSRFAWPDGYPSSAPLNEKIVWLGQNYFEIHEIGESGKSAEVATAKLDGLVGKADLFSKGTEARGAKFSAVAGGQVSEERPMKIGVLQEAHERRDALQITASLLEGDVEFKREVYTGLQESLLERNNYIQTNERTSGNIVWPDGYPSTPPLTDKFDSPAEAFVSRMLGTVRMSKNLGICEMEGISGNVNSSNLEISNKKAIKDVLASEPAGTIGSQVFEGVVKKDAASQETKERLVAMQNKISSLASELEWKNQVSSGLLESLLERNSSIQTVEVTLGKFVWPDEYPSEGPLSDKIKWLAESFVSTKPEILRMSENVGKCEMKGLHGTGESSHMEASYAKAMKEALSSKSAVKASSQVADELHRKDVALHEAQERVIALQIRDGSLEFEPERKKKVSSGFQESLVERNSHIQTVGSTLAKFIWPGEYSSLAPLNDKTEVALASTKLADGKSASLGHGEMEEVWKSAHIGSTSTDATVAFPAGQVLKEETQKHSSLLAAQENLRSGQLFIGALERELEFNQRISSDLQQFKRNRYIQTVEMTLGRYSWPAVYPTSASLNDRIEWLGETVASGKLESETSGVATGMTIAEPEELVGSVKSFSSSKKIFDSKLVALTGKVHGAEFEKDCTLQEANEENMALQNRSTTEEEMKLIHHYYCLLCSAVNTLAPERAIMTGTQVSEEIHQKFAPLQEAHDRIASLQRTLNSMKIELESEKKSSADLRHSLLQTNSYIQMVEDTLGRFSWPREHPSMASSSARIEWLCDRLTLAEQEVENNRKSAVVADELNQLRERTVLLNAELFCVNGENQAVLSKYGALTDQCSEERQQRDVALREASKKLLALQHAISTLKIELEFKSNFSSELEQSLVQSNCYAQIVGSILNRFTWPEEYPSLYDNVKWLAETFLSMKEELHLLRKCSCHASCELNELCQITESSLNSDKEVPRAKHAESPDTEQLNSSLQETLASHELDLAMNKVALQDTENKGLSQELRRKSQELEEARRVKDTLQLGFGQMEQKLSGVREKLGMAVKKGKLVEKQRDICKQSLEEKTRELDSSIIAHVQALQVKDGELRDLKLKLEGLAEERNIFVSTLDGAIAESSWPSELIPMELVDVIDWLALEYAHARETISLLLKSAEEAETRALSDRSRYDSELEEAEAQNQALSTRLEDMEEVLQQNKTSSRNIKISQVKADAKLKVTVDQLSEMTKHCELLVPEVEILQKVVASRDNEIIRLRDEKSRFQTETEELSRSIVGANIEIVQLRKEMAGKQADMEITGLREQVVSLHNILDRTRAESEQLEVDTGESARDNNSNVQVSSGDFEEIEFSASSGGLTNIDAVNCRIENFPAEAETLREKTETADTQLQELFREIEELQEENTVLRAGLQTKQFLAERVQAQGEAVLSSPIGDTPGQSSAFEEVEARGNWVVTAAPGAAHVRGRRPAQGEIVLEVDEESSRLLLDSGPGFAALTNSKTIPKATRSATNQFDVLCVEVGRLLMRQPLASSGVTDQDNSQSESSADAHDNLKNIFLKKALEMT